MNSNTLQAVQGILFSDDSSLLNRFQEFDLILFAKNNPAIKSMTPFPIEIIDYDFFLKNPIDVHFALKDKGFKVLLVNDAHSFVDLNHFRDFKYPRVFIKQSFSKSELIQQIEAQKENLQNEQLLEIAHRLTSDYEAIKSEWIEKIKAQEADLKESRLKLYGANKRNDILKKILFSVSFENDYLRLESILNEYIPKAADFAWVKLVPKNQSFQLQQELEISLKVSYAKFPIAEFDLYFIRSHLSAIKKAELTFLEKISDGVNFAVSRNEKTKSLAEQEKALSATMKSFPEPLLITDRNFNIYDSSQHFNKFIPKTSEGKALKCYESFFNRSAPCENCRLGKSFTVNGTSYEYAVASQTIKTDYDAEPLFLNIYFNQFETKKLEKKINENLEIQELGLISSSIAHELNNPIGGVHSLLQLIKMSSKLTAEQITELDDMLETSLRVQKIIGNLKEFSQKNDLNEVAEFLLVDLVIEALKAMDSELKEAKIQVSKTHFDDNLRYKLSDKLFIKTVKGIIFFLMQEFKRDLLSKKIRIIEVKTSQDQMGFNLEFISNTSRPQISESLRAIEFLNIQKLLIDQGFRGELFSPYPDWFGLKISLATST